MMPPKPRRGVLRWFAGGGLLAADDARDTLAWDNRRLCTMPALQGCRP
jgi:hypothetical protein